MRNRYIGRLRYCFFVPGLLLLCVQNGLTQTHTLDSLKIELSKHPQKDTIRIDILAWLAIENETINPIQAIDHIQEAISIAKTLVKSEREYGLWAILGWQYMHINDFPSAIETFQEILNRSPKDSERYWTALQFIGMVYKQQGDLDKALEYARLVNDAGKKIMANRGKFTDTRAGVGNAWNFSELYFKKNELDSAIIYSRIAYEELKKVPIEVGYQFRPQISLLMARAYINKKMKDSARVYLDDALEWDGKSYSDLVSSELKSAYATWNFFFGNLDTAKYYAVRAMNKFTTQSRYDMIIESSQLLRKISEKQGDYIKALQYVDIENNAKDSMIGFDKIKKTQAMHYEMQLKDQQSVNAQKELKLNNKIRLMGLTSIFICFVGVGLYTNIQRRKKIIDQLNKQQKTIENQKSQLHVYIDELKQKQTQLIHAEKMASLGELTAGIAHEIQNPLNFVNNFSEINKELMFELKEGIKKKQPLHSDEINDLIDDLEINTSKINLHGKRAESIVRSMLEHSQTKSGSKLDIDLNALIEEYIKLGYHAIRAKDANTAGYQNANVNIITELDPSIITCRIIPAEFGRVLINCFNNSFYSMMEKQKISDLQYHPTLTVKSKLLHNKVSISIHDNGMGISENILNKVFQPFFTTKPTGQGTGLGLSLSYDIITKAHGGTIHINSKEGEYCEFMIELSP